MKYKSRIRLFEMKELIGISNDDLKYTCYPVRILLKITVFFAIPTAFPYLCSRLKTG